MVILAPSPMELEVLEKLLKILPEPTEAKILFPDLDDSELVKQVAALPSPKFPEDKLQMMLEPYAIVNAPSKENLLAVFAEQAKYEGNLDRIRELRTPSIAQITWKESGYELNINPSLRDVDRIELRCYAKRPAFVNELIDICLEYGIRFQIE
jgi:hypothetical protein